MPIVHRHASDPYSAREWADEAVRHGWAIVAIVCESPSAWHVFALGPDFAPPYDWDHWVDIRRERREAEKGKA